MASLAIRICLQTCGSDFALVLDAEIGRQMMTTFLDDLRDAEEITLERFRRRSWLERPVEVAAKFLTRLL